MAKSAHPVSATARPQITPSGSVFWQGRVKVRSGLTLPNATPYWNPLGLVFQKTNANRSALPTIH
ncbi:MAG: hypothetical protein HXK22_04845 [Alloprevotella tannerae]|nr:hypothetical protein [Alloprevotella tannerae]